MNIPQIQSGIRTALKFIGGLLVAHGYAQAANEISLTNTDQVTGALATLGSFIWSLCVHASPTSNPPSGNAGKPSGGQSGLPVVGAMLLFFLVPVLFFTGCASAPANLYKTEATTDAVVSAAMSGWGAYVAQYHPPAIQEQQVKSFFLKFQQSELAVIDASESYVLESSTNSAANSGVVTTAQVAETQALTDLLNLLKQIETKN